MSNGRRLTLISGSNPPQYIEVDPEMPTLYPDEGARARTVPELCPNCAACAAADPVSTERREYQRVSSSCRPCTFTTVSACIPAPAAVPSEQYQQPPQQPMSAQTQPVQPQQKPVSKWVGKDLLDGKIDNTNLPPAMIPQPTSMTNQDLLRASAPSSSSVSNESLTLSAMNRLPGTPVSSPALQSTTAPLAPSANSSQTQSALLNNAFIAPSQAQVPPSAMQAARPAAAVMPIQHQGVTSIPSDRTAPVSTPAPETMPASAHTTIASSQSSRILPLSELMNPSKYELGLGDKTRLEKRQLHEHIRSGGDVPLPQLDPNDPLNTLDTA